MKLSCKAYSIFLFAFSLLFIISPIFGQNSRHLPDTVSLETVDDEWYSPREWRYSPEDNPSFATVDYDDSHWEIVNPRELSELKGAGVAWFRLYIKGDSSTINKSLILSMRQKGASEIYLDGDLLGEIGKIDTTGQADFKKKSSLPLMFTLKDAAYHVIAVRYQPYTSIDQSDSKHLVRINGDVRFKGEVIGETNSGFYFSVRNAQHILPAYVETKLDYTAICSIITGVFFALGFIHLLLFSFYPKARYNLFFALYNLSLALIAYCIPLIIYGDDIQKEGWDIGHWAFAGLATFTFALTGFVNDLFGKSKIRHVILLIVPLIGIVMLAIREEVGGIIVLCHFVFVFFESLYLIIRAMVRREKSAFIVGGGILLSFLFIIIILGSNWVGAGNMVEGFMDQHISYIWLLILFSFPVSISAYLGWQYAATNINLQKQLTEVHRLSDLSLKQEQEKQHILQNQNDLLEEQVAERTAELQLEKQKSDDLLLNILPQEVADELKEMGTTKAQHYDEVTVIFTDFVNFTENSERWGAEIMLRELNNYFTVFDHIMEKHGLEKIKTIGDAYLAVCGLPHQTSDHARRTVLAALDILHHVHERASSGENTLDIRIGIHSGPLVAGIVGVKKFAYDIWGDTVNTAARMEQTSLPGKINISEDTYQMVKDYFIFESRGKIRAKGKGELNMYFIREVSPIIQKDKSMFMDYNAVKKVIIKKLKEELSHDLTYHSVDHVKDVMAATERIASAEGITDPERTLLKTAALFHDAGFLYGAKDHEEKSCEIAQSYLPDYGYEQEDIDRIKGMIMATKIPQSPTNHLEEIIADADLDYLGRDDFFIIGDKLYAELIKSGVVTSDREWNELQEKFLESHQYFTQTAIDTRKEKKQQHLNMIKSKLASNS